MIQLQVSLTWSQIVCISKLRKEIPGLGGDGHDFKLPLTYEDQATSY